MKNLDTTLNKNKQNNMAITPGKGICLNDILYISGRGNCLAFFTKEEIILVKGHLWDIKHQLPEYFAQLNPNTIVNLDVVQQMSAAGRRELVEKSRAQQISGEQLARLSRLLKTGCQTN